MYSPPTSLRSWARDPLMTVKGVLGTKTRVSFPRTSCHEGPGPCVSLFYSLCSLPRPFDERLRQRGGAEARAGLTKMSSDEICREGQALSSKRPNTPLSVCLCTPILHSSCMPASSTSGSSGRSRRVSFLFTTRSLSDPPARVSAHASSTIFRYL